MSCKNFCIEKTQVPYFDTSKPIESIKEGICSLRKKDQILNMKLYMIFFHKGLQNTFPTPICPFGGNKNEICPKFEE